MADIEAIAHDTGIEYFVKKEATDALEKLRKEFFVAAAEVSEAKSLARKTVETPTVMDSEKSARAYAVKYHPGWRVIEVQIDTAEEQYHVIMEEDPNFIPYSVVVECDVADANGIARPGYVITKEIRSGSTLVDDERIIEEDPDLWERITVWENIDLLSQMNLTSKDLEQANWPRVLLHFELLGRQEIEDIKPYVYEGPKTLALKVRYAKDDELGEG